MILISSLGCHAHRRILTRTAVFTVSSPNPKSACTWTYVNNGTCPTCTDIVLGAGCTADDIFVNAAAGDFHLAADSPAIGMAECLAEVLTDFDGKPRPTPGRPLGQGCDIGAYQYTPVVPVTGLTVIGIEP